MPDSVALQINDPTRLVPSRIAASWRCGCPGQAAIVLWPAARRSLLLRLGLGPSVPNVAREVQAKDALTPDGPIGWAKGSNLPDGYRILGETDQIPAMLSAPPPEPAKGDAGEVRGTWFGRLILTETGPSVALQRKVATYASLLIWSDAKTGHWSWEATITADRWFTPTDADRAVKGTAPLLRDAILDGFKAVQGVVARACVLRDTGRRLVLDPAWAATRPAKPAPKPKKDTLDKVVAKAERTAKRRPKGTPKAEGYRAALARLRSLADAFADEVLAIVPAAAGGVIITTGNNPAGLAQFANSEAAERALRSIGRKLVDGGWAKKGRTKKAKPPKAAKAPKPPKAAKAPKPVAPASAPAAAPRKAPRRTPKAATASTAPPSDAALSALFGDALKAALAG